MLLVVAGACLAALPFWGSQPLAWIVVFAGILLGAWVPVELAVAIFLRANRELVRLDAATSESDEYEP
jgi:hypothetical protein